MSPALLPEFIEMQYLDFSQAKPSPALDLELSHTTAADHLPKLKAWQVKAGGSIEGSLTLSYPGTIRLELNLCAAFVREKTACNFNIRINDQLLVGNYFEATPVFHQVHWIVEQEMLRVGHNKIQIEVEENSSSPLLLNRLSIEEADIIFQQKLTLDTASPKRKSLFALNSDSSARFLAEKDCYILDQTKNELAFDLTLEQAKDLKVIFNQSVSLKGEVIQADYTLYLNDIPLFHSDKDQDPHFHDKGWILPKEYLKSGLNRLRLCLSKDSPSELLVRAVSMEEITTLPRQLLKLDQLKPAGNKYLRLLLQQGASYHPKQEGWFIPESGGYISLRLTLTQLIDLHLRLKFKTLNSTSPLSCPFMIKVNNGILLRAYDEAQAEEKHEEWLIPKSMLCAGDNHLLIQLPAGDSALKITEIMLEEN